MAQIALNARRANEPLAFFKTDHEAAYIQLPLDPAQEDHAMVALRRPALMTWYVLAPTSQLFGAEAAVMLYNFLSRAISVLANKIFGAPPPLLAYSGDMWALSPGRAALPALQTFRTFRTIDGYILKIIKTDIGREVALRGLLGKFPTPGTIWP